MTAVCWVADVTALADPERFSRGLEGLPWEERREKVGRFRFEADRLLCLGAGLLAARALRQAGAEDLTLEYNEYGKPYLVNHDSVCFSLSHSGSIAVCAVADAPIGADVEKPRKGNTAVARRCFTEDELRWMEGQEDRDLAFTRLWTRKESLLKRLGTGLSVPMESFSVCPDGSPEAVCRAAVRDACKFPTGLLPGPEACRFTETEVDGHLLCVCSGEGTEAAFRKMEFD